MLRIAILCTLLLAASACGDPADDGDVGDTTLDCIDTPCDTPEPGPTRDTPTPHTPAPRATVVASTLTASVPTLPRSAGTGTLEGYVHIGPTCPVVREGEDCDDRPHEADVEVVDANGTLVMTVRSDAAGNFTASLQSGDYRLVPRDTGRLPYASEQPFTINAGAITKVDVAYDSGIR